MMEGIVSSHSVYNSNTSDFLKTHNLSNYIHSTTTMEEYEIQRVRPPVPSWKEEMIKSAFPDPKLTLTPDKESKTFSSDRPKSPSSTSDRPKSPSASIMSKPSTKPKLKQKVRFDLDESGENDCVTEISSTLQTKIIKETTVNTVSDSLSKGTPQKEYCPKMYVSRPDQSLVNDKELDVTQTDDDPDIDDSQTGLSSLDQSDTERALKFLTIKESEQVKSDPPPIVDSVPAYARTQHAVNNVIVSREFENRPAPMDYQFPFVDHTVAVEPEHVFARPEYNSSLKISEELRDLKASKPKIAETLKQKLKQSEETRMNINEKASSKVNCSKDQFAALVNVELDVNSLCLQVEREITLKSRPKPTANKNISKKKYPIGITGTEPQVPDLLEFYSGDRQREIPDLHLTGINVPDMELATADPSTAFDIYRHNKVWES